jgi:hypothetical protein
LVFTAYFVFYLVALGYELAAVGFLFSLFGAVAVPCGILWDWVGSFHVRPWLVMARIMRNRRSRSGLASGLLAV